MPAAAFGSGRRARLAAGRAAAERSPARRPLAVLALGIACLGLVWFRYEMTTGAFRNSDDAGNFLAGIAMAGGNWNLHGWVLAVDDYVPTDVLAQACLRLAFGYHPIFMKLEEAVVWAAIAAVGTLLACLGAGRRHRAGIAALTLTLLAFDVFSHRFEDFFVSGVGSHGSTILLTLCCFRLFLAGGDGTARPRFDRSVPAALGLLVAIGCFADPIFLVVACAPMLAVAFLGLRGRRGGARPLARLAAVAGGVLLAHLLSSLERHNGGFRTAGATIALTSVARIPGNLAFAVEAIARLIGADFFDRSLDEPIRTGPAIYLLRAPLLFCIAAAAWRVGRELAERALRWPADGARAGRDADLEHLLWLGLVLCVAAATVTTVIVDQSGARFFLPAAVAGSILAGRRFGRVPLAALYGFVLLPVSIAFGFAALPPGTPASTITIPQVRELVDTLRSRGLRHGYAGYWEGTIVTALSHGTVTSLPLVIGFGGGLEPIRWFDDMDWFGEAARDWDGPVFFVVSRDPLPFEIPETAIVGRFGVPSGRIDLGQYVVLTYRLPRHALQAAGLG